MMTKILNFAKKNLLYMILAKLICKILFFLITVRFELMAFLRRHGLPSSKYAKVKALKGKYEGKRCFIMCTGPSLTISDMEILKNEYTFGMNSIPLLYENTDFRPSFYGCIDEGVWKKLRDIIKKYDNPSTLIFVGSRQTKYDKLRPHWYEIPFNVSYHAYDRWFKNDFWCKFGEDAYAGLYDMHSVTHFLIQLAVYMGFKEIYLLGADCNFPPNGQIHFKDYGVPDATIDTARERNIAGYEEVKRFCDAHGIKVFNSTRGGALEVFPRKDLDEVIKENNTVSK